MSLIESGEQRPAVIPVVSESSPAIVPFSPRQGEILGLLAQGFSKPKVGGLIGRSKHTINAHVRVIYYKLGGSCSIDEAIVRSFEAGMLDLDVAFQGLEPERIEALDPERRRLFDAVVEDSAAKPYKQIAPLFRTREQEIKRRAAALFKDLGVINRTHALTLELARRASVPIPVNTSGPAELF